MSNKTQEELDEEMFRGMLDTVDDMFGRLFPLFPMKMFCEAEDAELIKDEEEDGEQADEE